MDMAKTNTHKWTKDKTDPRRYSRCLTGKQLEIARRLMLKYCGQPAAHANIHKPKVTA